MDDLHLNERWLGIAISLNVPASGWSDLAKLVTTILELVAIIQLAIVGHVSFLNPLALWLQAMLCCLPHIVLHLNTHSQRIPSSSDAAGSISSDLLTGIPKHRT
jgi:hypothetical protein